MTHLRKHVLEDYWRQDDLLATPVFKKFMSRDRFTSILRFLHFANNEPDDEDEEQDEPARPRVDDRIYKVRYVFEALKEKFRTSFKPFQKVVIDESLVLFRGRLAFKQYIPSKRHRFGIKLFVLCDCETGIILDAIVYTGTHVDIPEKDPLGYSGAVVRKMMTRYLNQGHILYTDNWYTSPSLSKFLLENGTGSCGTVRATRKFMPKFPKTKRDECKLQASGQILAMRWTDKRDVTMLSTIHKGTLKNSGKKHYRTGEPVMKPDIVIDYNENMRLIDKSDMQIGSCECVRKSNRWYKKLFCHMVDVTMLNAYNLWKVKTGGNIPFRTFSYNVIKQLLAKFGTVQSSHSGRIMSSPPDRLLARDYIAKHHLTSYPAPTSTSRATRKSAQRACWGCNNTTRKDKTRKMTTSKCNECNLPLCQDCFRDYHTVTDF